MDNSFKKAFGARLKYLRKLAGLSQEKLAEYSGLSSKTISYIENGKNAISFSRLPLLAKALEIPVYKLFVFSDLNSGDNKEILDYLDSMTKNEKRAVADVIKTILSIK